MNKPAHDLVRSLLSYDPATGEFRWSNSRRNGAAGRLAGTIGKGGYRFIAVCGKRCRAHRLAWLWMTGAWPTNELDHINGNPADNAWSNLREATRVENCRNRAETKRSKTGVAGVYWDGGRNRWSAFIGLNGRSLPLGRFDSLEAAQAARVTAERQHYGAFARSTKGIA